MIQSSTATIVLTVALIGAGVLFVGLELMTDGVKPLIDTDAFIKPLKEIL